MASSLLEPAVNNTSSIIEWSSLSAELVAGADALQLLSERIAVAASSSTTSSSSTHAAILSHLLQMIAEFKATVTRIVRHRSQWLSKHAEELDGNEKHLLACARACDANILEDLDMLHLLEGSAAPLYEGNTFYRWNLAICPLKGAFSDARAALEESSRVQRDIDSESCIIDGQGASWCVLRSEPSAEGAANAVIVTNRIRVLPRDSHGEAFRDVSAPDVTVSIHVDGAPVGDATLHPTPVGGDGFHFTYSVTRRELGGARAITLITRLFGAVIKEVHVPVVGPVKGTLLNTFNLDSSHHSRCNSGLAVNDAESIMAVTSFQLCRVSFYSLPDGTLLRSATGGALNAETRLPTGVDTGFNTPRKICFGPTGNLLVAELDALRVQEVTAPDCVHVRFIGLGAITSDSSNTDNGGPIGLTCSPEYIAAGWWGYSKTIPQVYLFSYATGAHIRSFGLLGSAPGSLSLCGSMRFSPDGARLLVGEYDNHRVSIFEVPSGRFVSCIGGSESLYQPRDIAFWPNGDLLVAHERGEVAVFSAAVASGEVPQQEAQAEASGLFGDEFADAESMRESRPVIRFPMPVPASDSVFTSRSTRKPTALAVANLKVYVLEPDAPRVHVFM